MNPDSLGRVATRLVAGAAVGLMVAAAFAAPVAAQEDYEPFLHGDVTITGAAAGATANATPVFFQQQDLAADTAAVVVSFSAPTVPGTVADVAYDNCTSVETGAVDCVFAGFTGTTGTAYTLTGPIGYAVPAGTPGPIEVCGCEYTVATIDEAELAEYPDLPTDPEDPNLLGITEAGTWDDPAATADAGSVSVVSAENKFDLYIEGTEQVGTAIGTEPMVSLFVRNAGPADAADLAVDEPGSYVLRGRLPDGTELTQLNSDGNAAWTCLDESELAAEYARTENTLLDRFDFVCHVQSIAADDHETLRFYAEITGGANEPGRFEVAPTYTSEYSENLDAVPYNDMWFVLSGMPAVPLARNDFNDDGLDDLISVRETDGALRLHAGNGDGTFDGAVTVATGWAGYDVVMAGEVNSDGYADLLVRDNAAGILYTYPGDGNGGFGTRIRSGSSWNTMGVYTTADVTGDGMTDVLAVRNSDGGMYAYPGNGDGTFGGSILFGLGYNYIDAIVSVGDVDKDGAEDLMIRDSQTKGYWVLASTAETWIELSPSLDDGSGRVYRSVTGAGDLDRDGYVDLLSVDTRTSALYRHSFELNGYVQPEPPVQSSGWIGVSLPMVTTDRAHDFDEDGGDDIIVRRESDGNTFAYYGNGAGGFTASYSWGTTFSGMNLLATAGDFTGDGLADVIGRVGSSGALYVYPGTGIGDYDYDARIRIGTGWNIMSAIVSAYDYNGDLKVDIIAREASTGVLWLYPGKANGTVGTRIQIGTGWNAMKEITAIGDLDNDGTADLIAVRTSDNCLYFYGGKPTGGVKNGVKIGCGWAALDNLTAAGDFSGDGHIDLVARRTSDGKLFMYKGNGQGSFGSSTQIGSGWGGFDLFA
ncbi:VCBS repeat-containing protein [Glycomyces sp. NPDC047010]|uniref:VCBS repeat-containing protein n=1 Tax=Glycomyces sp. NPDC047010 TaxID=3155023 RepID=UPI0033FBCB3B